MILNACKIWLKIFINWTALLFLYSEHVSCCSNGCVCACVCLSMCACVRVCMCACVRMWVMVMLTGWELSPYLSDSVSSELMGGMVIWEVQKPFFHHFFPKQFQWFLPGSAKIIFLTPSISKVANVVGRLENKEERSRERLLKWQAEQSLCSLPGTWLHARIPPHRNASLFTHL